jgi:hypothetical protein
MASPLGSSGRGMSTAGTAASAVVAMICDPASSDGASPTCGTLSTTAAGSAASSTASGRAAGASAGLGGGIAGMADPAAPAARGPAGNSGGCPFREPPAAATTMPPWSGAGRGPGTPAPAGAPPVPQPGAPTSAFPSACAKPVAVPSVPPGTAPALRGGAVVGKLSSTSMIGSGSPARHGPAE